jgi:hypothetical protein
LTFYFIFYLVPIKVITSGLGEGKQTYVGLGRYKIALPISEMFS